MKKLLILFAVVLGAGCGTTQQQIENGNAELQLDSLRVLLEESYDETSRYVDSFYLYYGMAVGSLMAGDYNRAENLTHYVNKYNDSVRLSADENHRIYKEMYQ